MTTTETRRSTEPTKTEIQSFRMPRPQPTQIIKFYPMKGKRGGPWRPAVVTEVSDRLISCQELDGTPHDSVRHFTDPKLRLSPEQRENGAWDFGADVGSAQPYDDSDLRDRLAKTEELLGQALHRLDELETAPNASVATPRPKK